MPQYNPIGMFAHFIFGILAAGAMTMIRRNADLHARLTHALAFDIVAAASLFAMLLVMVLWRDTAQALQDQTNQPFLFPFVSMLCMSALVGLALSQRVGRWLDNPFFLYTAKISFGIYIWHYLIIEVLRPTVVQSAVYGGISSGVKWLLFACGVTLASYLAGDLSYRFIEQPAMRWRSSRLAANARKRSAQDEPPRSVT